MVRLIILLLIIASVGYFILGGMLGLGALTGRWEIVLALVIVGLSPMVVVKWRRGSAWHRSDK
jgi:hypothetical protein